MFGWFMILSTAVMQKYGLFPNPDVPLQYKDWGAARTVEKGGEGVPAPRVPPEPLEARRLAQPVRFARGAGSRKGLRRTGWGARGQGWRLLLRQRSGSLGRARRSLVASLPPCSCPLLRAPPLSLAGALTQQGFGTFITNERAIIMIAHIHALTVSAAAAFGPQVTGRQPRAG